jgi:hypothetical protein
VLIAIAAVAAFGAFAAYAFAASPHFIGTPTCSKNADFSLTCSGKAAGLANVVTGAFLTSSGGTADLQCTNKGGNPPPPKRVDFGPLTGETENITPRNGNIRFGPTLGPPPLPSPADICPNKNWSIDIISLTYFDVELHIQQGGVDILTFDFGDVDP